MGYLVAVSTPSIPHCPKCSYDLSGVAPTPQADPDGMARFTCPECGASVTMLAALNQREPDKHPKLTALMMLIIAISWFVLGISCLSCAVLGLRSCGSMP